MGVNLQRAILLYEQSRYDLAEKELRQELAGDPNNAHAHALLALCLCEREEYKEATDEAQMAIGHAPDFPFAHYALGKILHERNRFDEALLAAKEAIRLDPVEADYYSLVSLIFLSLRRWPEALDTAEHGLKQNPEHVPCTNLRAVALVKLGRRNEAGETISSALAKDPENAVTHANQGWRLLHENQPQKAMEHFREALRLEPNYEWARLGIVEALKANYFLYGLMLRYFLWMSRLSRKMGLAFVIGGYVGYRALYAAAEKNPSLAPYVWPILGCYIGFALMSWIAIPLFNLVLRLNRFGRLALSDDEKYASNWVGAGILLAIVVGVSAAVSGHFIVKSAAWMVVPLIVPLAGTFLCSPGWPRRIMGAYTLCLYVIAAAVVVLFIFGLQATTKAEVDQYIWAITNLQDIHLWGYILVPWLCNFLVMSTPRK